MFLHSERGLKSLFFLMLLICSHELRKNISHYKRTGGSESRTQVLASYCSSDVIDPGSHTHTSPEGFRGILGLSRHMTNCSVLLHEAHQCCKKSSARGGSDASAFCWSSDTYKPKTDRRCCLLPTCRRLCHLLTRQVVLTWSLKTECTLHHCRWCLWIDFQTLI